MYALVRRSTLASRGGRHTLPNNTTLQSAPAAPAARLSFRNAAKGIVTGLRSKERGAVEIDAGP